MVGRVILGILLALLAALVIALTIPARVRLSYDQGALAVWVRYGPIRLQIFPPKEKPSQEESADPSPKKQKKRKKQKREKKPPKPRAKINLDQILYSLETLPPILARLLGRTGRGVRVEPLKVHLLIACADPADTAQLYGRLCAALSAGLPLLERAVRIKDQDIRLFPDFMGEQPDGLHCRRGRVPAALDSGMGGPAGRWERAEVVFGLPEAGLAAAGSGDRSGGRRE